MLHFIEIITIATFVYTPYVPSFLCLHGGEGEGGRCVGVTAGKACVHLQGKGATGSDS